MSDSRLTAESCLPGGRVARTFKRAGDIQVRIEERFPVFVLEVAAFRGLQSRDIEHFEATTGARPPTSGNALRANNIEVAALGPNRWTIIAHSELIFTPGDNFAVTDLGSARTCFIVSGPKAAIVLAKGTSIDLHPSVFPAGSAAATRISHFSALIWQLDMEDGFSILTPRSYAQSFYDWLVLAASEFGGETQAL